VFVEEGVDTTLMKGRKRRQLSKEERKKKESLFVNVGESLFVNVNEVDDVPSSNYGTRSRDKTC
jgi:hypothetical protein